MAHQSPPLVRPSGNLILCGKSYLTDAPVVNFYDNPSYSAYRKACYRDKNWQPTNQVSPFAPAKGLEGAVQRYRERRLMGGTRDLRRLQEIIRQFVLHHDGCASSDMCFHVLHDERGLSVHFLIDNDGTIYQTLDLADGAFHATGVNEISIGVELCSRGKVELDGPNYYRNKFPHNPMVRDRNVTRVRIHTSNYEMWEYTPGQYDAMIRLGKALTRLLPNLPQTYPAYPDGNVVPTWLVDPRAFAGYVGHYHVTNQKWDPGCFNFRFLCDKIRARASWFVCLDRDECPRAPEIAEDVARAEAQAEELVRNNEEEAMGGFFPVGPFGKSRLWHGGIHINLNEGTPLFCPFPGKIVAARFGDDVAIGSRNFVLTRHTFHLGGQWITFFLLFYHLENVFTAQRRPPWLAAAERQPFYQRLMADEVVDDMHVDLAGGDVLGFAGHAGPPGNYEGQVHVEVMAAEDIGQKLQPDFWEPIDGSRTGPFCEVKEILSPIDRQPRDGQLSAAELRQFFQRDDRRADLRRMAVRAQSEWGAAPDYEAQLLRSRDFASLPKSARARLFRDQIEPTLWWTEELAEKVGLPKDFIVWHYHPVRFIAWMNGMLLKRATQAGPLKIGEGAAAKVDDGLSQDNAAYTDEEDEYSIEAGRKLTLEDLVRGYPEEKEK
jgi:N-acetyl-anhydromuramyl-L-alanine amidase AmpD